MKTTKTDLKLMLELQKDGRASYSDLSKRLGITPKTVAKRVEKLIESNIISIRAQPNPFKLGLSTCAVIAIKSKPADINAICDHLSHFFYVNLVQTFFGRFDILAIVYFPDWEMLHQFINEQLYTIDGAIQIELFFVKDVLKRYERFFKKEPFVKEPLKLKEIDWKLMTELARDGRSNPATLAEKLGVHVTTIYRRISVLTDENIIKISGVPNPTKLDHSASAYIMLDVDPKEERNVSKSLFNYPEIHFIMMLNKRSGMIICVHMTDTASLYEFLKNKVAGLKGVTNTETFVGASVKKTYYGWLTGIG